MRQKKKKQSSRYKSDTTKKKKKTKIQLKKDEDKIVWGSDIYKKK